MVRQLLRSQTMVSVGRVWVVALMSMAACSRAAEPTVGSAPPTAVQAPAEAAQPGPAGLSRLRGGPSLGEPSSDADAALLAGQQEPSGAAVLAERQPLATVAMERTATVRTEPRVSAPAVGLLAAGARVEIYERVPGEGCVREWLAVVPHGFVCAQTAATSQEPTGMLPVVPDGARVPGIYGSVAKQALVYASLDDAAAQLDGREPGRHLTVRRERQAVRGGQTFWKTRYGWFAGADVRRFRGSEFSGELLDGGLDNPMVWTLPAPKARTVPVLAEPAKKAEVVAHLGPRRARRMLEQRDGYARIDEGWVELARVRIAKPTAAPQGIAADERWVDIDLDQQVLVAYEGATPVYATLVSTGKAGHTTPTGIYRISRKVAERTMNSMSDSSDSYSVDKVPWTAYFAHGYALHAAFWHGGFGRRRSHGCVNLAPHDARALYDWMSPAAAPGWAEVYGNADQPGAVVRVRSRRDPEPSWKGYAQQMREGDASVAMAAATVSTPVTG